MISNRFLSVAAGALMFATAVTAQDAKLTVIHGIPGLSAPVDVFANNSKLFSFSFKESKGPLSLKPASYKLEVKLQGTTVLSTTAKVEANKNYTVIAHLKEKTGLALTVFENNLDAIAAGKSRLVVRHTAKAPAVDVGLTAGGKTVGTLKNLSNPGQTSVEVDAGNYEASLFAAGTSTKAFGPAKLSLMPGMSYVVYAVGDLSAKSFGLFIQTIKLDVQPQLTVIHGIPGLPAAVDVFANNGKLFSFKFKESKGPLSLKPATYKLEVKLNSTTVLSADAKVAVNKNYTVIAHLDAKGGNALSIFENDTSKVQPGRARLTVRHTAQAPAVDVALTSSGTEVAKFKNLSNPKQVSADILGGSYAATLFAAGTTTKAFGPADLMLKSGTSYIVYAIGSLTGKTFGLFVQTIDVDSEPRLKVSFAGTSCGGRIWTSNPSPLLGEKFDILLYGGSANQPAFLNVGLSNTDFGGGVKLPLDGKAFGVNGCMIYTSIDAVFSSMTNFNGEARLTVMVPRHLNLIDSLYAQWWYPSAGANPTGVRTTGYMSVIKD